MGKREQIEELHKRTDAIHEKEKEITRDKMALDEDYAKFRKEVMDEICSLYDVERKSFCNIPLDMMAKIIDNTKRRD